MKDEPIPGSCLCGFVAFEVRGAVHLLSHCHCSMCRKFSGSAFLTFGRTSKDLFAWTRGEELVRSFESSPGAVRSFCNHCGSPVPVIRPGLANVLIPAGAFDADPQVRPSFHMFVAQRAPWHEVTDALPQWAAWPQDADIETLRDAQWIAQRLP